MKTGHFSFDEINRMEHQTTESFPTRVIIVLGMLRQDPLLASSDFEEQLARAVNRSVSLGLQIICIKSSEDNGYQVSSPSAQRFAIASKNEIASLFKRLLPRQENANRKRSGSSILTFSYQAFHRSLDHCSSSADCKGFEDQCNSFHCDKATSTCKRNPVVSKRCRHHSKCVTVAKCQEVKQGK